MELINVLLQIKPIIGQLQALFVYILIYLLSGGGVIIVS